MVDPLLVCIEETAARLPSVDQAAYMLNCLYQIYSTLSLYEFVDERLDTLQSLMENHLVLLSTEQATSLIHSLGLSAVCSLLQNRGSDEVLSNIPGMDPSSLHSFLVIIFLFSCSMFWFCLIVYFSFTGEIRCFTISSRCPSASAMAPTNKWNSSKNNSKEGPRHCLINLLPVI